MISYLMWTRKLIRRGGLALDWQMENFSQRDGPRRQGRMGAQGSDSSAGRGSESALLKRQQVLERNAKP